MMTDANIPGVTAGTDQAGLRIDDRLRAVEAGVVRLETRFGTEMKHVATKADLELHFNRLLRWDSAS